MGSQCTPLTLDDIENIPKEFLLASDIAPYLGSDAGTIHYYAKKDPAKLGFPVIVTGKMLRIPKAAFIRFCKYGSLVDYEQLSEQIADKIALRILANRT